MEPYVDTTQNRDSWMSLYHRVINESNSNPNHIPVVMNSIRSSIKRPKNQIMNMLLDSIAIMYRDLEEKLESTDQRAKSDCDDSSTADEKSFAGPLSPSLLEMESEKRFFGDDQYFTKINSVTSSTSGNKSNLNYKHEQSQSLFDSVDGNLDIVSVTSKNKIFIESMSMDFGIEQSSRCSPKEVSNEESIKKIKLTADKNKCIRFREALDIPDDEALFKSRAQSRANLLDTDQQNVDLNNKMSMDQSSSRYKSSMGDEATKEKPEKTENEISDTRYNLPKQYDKVQQRKSVCSSFRYKAPVIRRKSERAKLPGWDCEELYTDGYINVGTPVTFTPNYRRPKRRNNDSESENE